MSKQIKLAIGSVFVLATLVLITTGAASAQGDRSHCCQKIQQPVSSPSQSYPPGYIRGK